LNVLFLDLASRKPTIALVTEEEVLKFVWKEEKILEHELLPLVEEMLASAGISLESPKIQEAKETKSLTHIACVTGPGGFTSVRLGVATANAIAYSLKIPIAGIPLSDERLAMSDQRLETTLPALLSRLSYDDPPIAPEYGSRPFVTLRRQPETSNQ
jgi:tRNA threonylcarbamoyl adenosine modification protein YeaZ